MPHLSEYEVETRFLDRLESLGYTFAPLNNYDDVLANFRLELAKFNAPKLLEAKGEAAFSDAEFKRVLIQNAPVVPWHDDNGILTISLTDFLLKEGALDW